MDITFKNVNYTYQANSPLATVGLKNINLEFRSGTYTAIIGQTGSGKSTLLQHLNALLRPTSGEVVVGSQVVTPTTKNKELYDLRRKVGLVFQFPESQLFEETVLKDVAFAPKNFGKSEDEANQIAKEALRLVGIDESLENKMPFDLSGGQMRRVAIAGVLAMEPEVLVLDEPTAGLDPLGRQQIMDLFLSIHQKRHLTTILVTHQMDDVVNYADDVAVLEHGEVIKFGTPQEVFADLQWLNEHNLELPSTGQLVQQLIKKGFQFERLPLTEAELITAIKPQLERGPENG
ncbi:ABC transporter family protein [Lapidilactobacillus dextrinicus DSM 20335]|uniref:Energy-coupling factor transporter ATP-binding protein EcfA2 n=1 Tax=Lapidilactobacillus dextrinicus DSM 20335 TaxID=1423738 RepID=A0A0R2BHW4_9LACO|nr:energy-coupling factor ABC transporter ATP-binding protein [Lapidilactobacillus dextrinicus]KRM78794.1 ABC transporter family protein [Lapidilactobacillus dextrinicus DSM 20335]QFG46496.1 energy-coupling factor ABC transporter ATP-binding protein [Lapidilactobacillus dextrinicus]